MVSQIIEPKITPIAIRPAQAKDFAAIASIYNEAIAHGGITMDGQPQTAADVGLMVGKMTLRECLLVGDVDGRVVGWGIVKRYSDRLGYQVCCETSIYLTFSETGKGYGGALQTALMQKVFDFDYHHIVAKILAANVGSIRFHQRFGFELVGIQKEIGYINGTWHDVAILQYIVPEGRLDDDGQTSALGVEI